jgi:hypothetical protein
MCAVYLASVCKDRRCYRTFTAYRRALCRQIKLKGVKYYVQRTNYSSGRSRISVSIAPAKSATPRQAPGTGRRRYARRPTIAATAQDSHPGFSSVSQPSALADRASASSTSVQVRALSPVVSRYSSPPRLDGHRLQTVVIARHRPPTTRKKQFSHAVRDHRR